MSYENIDPNTAAFEVCSAALPSFEIYIPISKRMLDHEMFPPAPKNNKNPTYEWYVDELALRIEFCTVKKIPHIFANNLVKIGNKYSEDIQILGYLLSSRAPDAEFFIVKSDDKECIINCRRTKYNKDAEWIPVRYTVIEAQERGLLDKAGVHWHGEGRQNMIAKNCLSKAANNICRVEINSCHLPEEFAESEINQIEQLKENKVMLTEGSKSMMKLIKKLEEPLEEVKKVEPKIEINVEPIEEIEDLSTKTEIVKDPILKENLINNSPISKEEVKQIITEKIATMPVSELAPIEELPPLEEVIDSTIETEKLPEPPKTDVDYDFADEYEAMNHEDPKSTEPIEEPNVVKTEEKKKKKSSKKTLKDVLKKKIDTSFIDEATNVESTPLKIPYPLTRMEIEDGEFYDEVFFKKIGNDWFTSVTVTELNQLVIEDYNIDAFKQAIKTMSDNENVFIKICEIHAELMADFMNAETLIVELFYMAMLEAKVPPDLLKLINISYLKIMSKMIKDLEKLAEMIKGVNPQLTPNQILPFMQQASGDKWNNKQCAWGYRYMKARELI